MKKLGLTLLLALTAAAQAQSQTDHWVGTWSTAPLQTTSTGATVALGIAPAAPHTADGTILSRPTNAPARIPPGTTDITLRQVVHISLGGSSVRVVLTNEYGTDPLTVAAASVELADKLEIGSMGRLTFNGQRSIIIPPGAIVVSDPVTMNIPSFSNLEINLFVPAQTIAHITMHTGALQTSYTTPGNTVDVSHSLIEIRVPQPQPIPGNGFDSSVPDPVATPIYSWSFLKSVDVLAPADAGAVIAFGDSITDGAYATRDQNARWPDDLARRLAANPATAHLSVLNEGIGGNRVLHDNTGPSALARFTRDALDQTGVRYIIFLEAINDIGHAYTATNPNDVVTAADLIQGYMQMIDRAHIRGIKVIGATLTPYGGASYASPAGEKVRQAVNQWIRTTKSLDGFIDFDKATQDPAHPDAFLPAFDHGDHLHPSDAGYTAMSNAIDLTLFTK